MDFVVGFPRTQKQYDTIWVILHRLTEYGLIIPIKSTYSEEDYARNFIDDIVCLNVFFYPSCQIG